MFEVGKLFKEGIFAKGFVNSRGKDFSFYGVESRSYGDRYRLNSLIRRVS